MQTLKEKIKPVALEKHELQNQIKLNFQTFLAVFYPHDSNSETEWNIFQYETNSKAPNFRLPSFRMRSSL